jgi:hypothetical protein
MTGWGCSVSVQCPNHVLNIATKRKHDPPKYLTTRKSDMHEEPDWRTSESGNACAFAEEEGEEH